MAGIHPRIAIALLLGVLLIGGTVFSVHSPLIYERASDERARAETAKRTALPPLHAARDGVDQHENIANTYTEKLAISTFTKLLEGTKNDPNTIASSTTRALIGSMSSDTRYTRDDLSIIPETSTSRRNYGNRVAEILLTPAATTEGRNELTIFIEAIDTESPRVLDELKSIADGYATMVGTLNAVAVPEGLVDEHLTLLSALDAVSTNIHAMAEAFKDPVYALTRLKRYGVDVYNLNAALEELYQTLYERGTEFREGEPTRTLILPE